MRRALMAVLLMASIGFAGILIYQPGWLVSGLIWMALANAVVPLLWGDSVQRTRHLPSSELATVLAVPAR